jgi:hypothetical protein
MFNMLKYLFLLFPLITYADVETADKIVYIGDIVYFNISVLDLDCDYTYGYEYLNIDQATTVTWSAVWKGTTQPAGSFPNGSIGNRIAWQAPSLAGDVEIIATCDNNSSQMSIDPPVTDKIWVEVSAYYRTGGWIPIYPSGSECSWHCEDDDLRFIKHDDFMNELKLSCSDHGFGAIIGCAWEFYYDGFLISRCLFPNGANDWYYKKKFVVGGIDDGKWYFYKLKHVTLDGDCSGGCPGYCCAKLTYYDCETCSSDGSCWRRTKKTSNQPSNITYCFDGESCPGGH